jgi:hypothetical protein
MGESSKTNENVSLKKTIGLTTGISVIIGNIIGTIHCSFITLYSNITGSSV